MGEDSDRPGIAELDRLDTDELRERAVTRAERRRDVGFFWDLLRHLAPAQEIAVEDGSPGHIGATFTELIELVREVSGNGYGDLEPLYRARFIDYLRG